MTRVSRESGPTDPHSVSEASPSFRSDYVTDLNHVEEDQVSLVSTHDVTNPLVICLARQ